jgi:hypothetical protein
MARVPIKERKDDLRVSSPVPIGKIVIREAIVLQAALERMPRHRRQICRKQVCNAVM